MNMYQNNHLTETSVNARWTIVIPMAGLGTRFQREGYTMPKPLIQVGKQPMIEIVLNNLRPSRHAYRFIFIVRREHAEKFGIDRVLKTLEPTCEIAYLEEPNAGCPITLLENRALIGGGRLLIANCDQFLDTDIDSFLDACETSGYAGMTMTATNTDANDSKWSYVQFDKEGHVISVREKQVVSDQANCGIFAFMNADSFFEAAQAMVEAGETVNGEYYVAPTYNRIIASGGRVGYYNIGTLGEGGFFGLGVPADLQSFLQNGPMLCKALGEEP